jgi:hypothetical protein
MPAFGEIGMIVIVAAVALLVLCPFRMSLSFELNGNEKIFSFNVITFWILLTSGEAHLAWYLAGMIGRD